jgi:hypothetical protein
VRFRPVIFAAAVLLAGCTGSSSVVPTPAFDRIDVYEQLFRHLARHRSVGDPLIIVTEVCVNRGVVRRHPRCDARFSPDEQRDLAARLADVATDIRFAASTERTGMTARNREDAQVVWAGPLDAAPDGYRSVVGTICGGDCGWGGTLQVDRDGDDWIARGYVPGTSQWVA